MVTFSPSCKPRRPPPAFLIAKHPKGIHHELSNRAFRLERRQQNLDVIGNNIANANTVGMKSSRAEFSNLVASSLERSRWQPGGHRRQHCKHCPAIHQGNINITGNSLDVAIKGGGFQETMPDGSLAYTRAGDFKLDATGFMKTNSGGKLMGCQPTSTGSAPARR